METKHDSYYANVRTDVIDLLTGPYDQALVWDGKWDYETDGVMDSTHLRFFTRKSALALLGKAGLTDLRLTRNPQLKRGKKQVAGGQNFWRPVGRSLCQSIHYSGQKAR